MTRGRATASFARHGEWIMTEYKFIDGLARRLAPSAAKRFRLEPALVRAKNGAYP